MNEFSKLTNKFHKIFHDEMHKTLHYSTDMKLFFQIPTLSYNPIVKCAKDVTITINVALNAELNSVW